MGTKKTKTWEPRKQRGCIGRIVYSHPASGERYYLRMLLNVVKGPRSFEELRTLDGTVQNTFKDTYFAYGLINDDKEWAEEISWEALSDDILHKKRIQLRYPDMILTEAQIQNYCLVEIQMLLNKNGKALSDFPDLPQPDPSLISHLDNRLIREELNYNIQELKAIHDSLYSSLNPDQLKVYESIIGAVNAQVGGLFFVYGPGGTGKTFLYKTILTKLRSGRMIVLAVASSGIASLLLPDGRTAHIRFVIPLELLENSTCGIKQNTHLAELLHEVKLLILDEAPMTQRYAFEVFDKTL
ncbi:uncharacterized protein [Rutidosis leptorrhynchoides]|uniref:uncharacterized protein n=1 Tax=Rutidosis leptorrhynchoides TaxID=125765 RepID=UPI003A98F786